MFRAQTEAEGDAPRVHVPFVLPSEFTIYAVAELRPQLLAWVESAGSDSGSRQVHGQAVDEVDAAGLQLLAALDRSLGDRGETWQLIDPSLALREACELLGLQGWMSNPAKEA